MISLRSIATAWCLAAISAGASDAAFERRPLSAATGGTADAAAPIAPGLDALFANPGALIGVRPLEAGVLAARPYGLAELESIGAGVVVSRRGAAFGAGALRFGVETFREETLSVGAAVRFRRRLSVGGSVRVLRLAGTRLTTRTWMAFDLGIRLRAGPTTLGLVAWNTGGAAPGIVGRGGAVGFGTAVTERASLWGAVRKHAGRPVGLRAGVSLAVGERVVLRAGAGRGPETLAAGARVRVAGIVLDYAVLDHATLGLSSRPSLIFGLGASTALAPRTHRGR